ncbi:hypothetical protein [Tardiphaga robiniae]|uniref:hypothetical protein n=1 Tax=Tardiphaga robiniae TaxID=943830 RepID=UPI001586527F|nr:hypothetical protein [Tardiphaga robiniae]NUU41850.1 hypothetical protein [Tardiphaga robiniae]
MIEKRSQWKNGPATARASVGHMNLAQTSQGLIDLSWEPISEMLDNPGMDGRNCPDGDCRSSMTASMSIRRKRVSLDRASNLGSRHRDAFSRKLIFSTTENDDQGTASK